MSLGRIFAIALSVTVLLAKAASTGNAELLAECIPTLKDTGIRIPVGLGASRAAITPNGAEVYVSNEWSDTVSVIRTATNLVTHTIDVGSRPDSLAVTTDGSKVFVGQHGGDVSVIDTATKFVGQIRAGDPVRDVVLTLDNEKLYLAMEFGGLLSFNTRTGTLSTASQVICPEALAVSPNGQFLYVNYQCFGPGGSGGHDAIGIFNAATGAFVGSITGLPNVGGHITISPDGAQLWANGLDACFPYYDQQGCPQVGAGVLNVIGTANHRLVKSIGFAGFNPWFTTILPGSSRAAVGNFRGDFPDLYIFDTRSFEVVQTILIPASGSLAFTSTVSHALAPLLTHNTVAVLPVSCAGANSQAN